jgi:uncharacterized membrane protein YhhN
MGWLLSFSCVALIDWVASGKQWRRVRLLSKPLSLALLIAWFSSQGGWISTGVWFGAGLIFSFIGDVFLLLRPRFFLAGLFAFLLAHLSYITGFLQGKIQFSWLIIVPVFLVVTIGVLLYPRIIRSVRRKLENHKLTIPVTLYMLTITSMVFVAQMTWFKEEWGFWGALGASVGAMLFLISDSVLAIGRFSYPILFSNFLIMFTYHLGQLAITFGILSRLGLLA